MRVDTRAALGSVHAQLVLMVDAARLDESANVIVSCGSSAIELSFSEGGIVAEAGRDASTVAASAVSPEDEIVLEILGWRPTDGRGGFMKKWHEHTATDDVADDVVRAAVHAYQCDSVELKLLLRETAAPGAHVPAQGR